jgi:hypothetical protein
MAILPRAARLLLVVWSCTACTGAREATSVAQAWPTPIETFAVPHGGGFLFGEQATWLEYIPKHIPPLEDKITLVMEGPDTLVQIQYEGLTTDQVTNYLSRLKQAGFQPQ